jgi:hypothetical protein
MNSSRRVHGFVLRQIVPLALSLSLPLAVCAAPPEPAADHGYTVNTFSSNFTAQSVDMNHTLNRNFKWYLLDLLGKEASPAGVKINGDGSVTLLGDPNGATSSLASMVPYRGTNTFVGTAFGGGLYIEAVMSYDPAQVASSHPSGTVHGYPGFWSLPAEGNIQGSSQWPGQAAGYDHHVEVDFFEADEPNKPTAYGVGLHDWYGIPNVTCNPGLCSVSFTNPTGERVPPAGTDFKQYHTYGFLWVPATASSQGYVDAYFDGEIVGRRHSWSQYTNQAPTPVGQPWAFGRIDQQHLIFMLGTGTGEPLNVKSINVWQTGTAGNWTN